MDRPENSSRARQGGRLDGIVVMGERVESKSKARILVERLAGAIANGSLRPGQVLPSERILAQELSVSRSVVREALASLIAAGLLMRVECRPPSVFSAPDPQFLRAKAAALLADSSDPFDACVAREAIEPSLAPMIVESSTDEDFGKLAAAENSLARACEGKNWVEQAQRDQEFHGVLVAATHSRAAVRALEPLLGEMVAPGWLALRARFFEEQGGAASSIGRHRKILEAVLDRDVAALQESLRDHFRAVRSVLEYGASLLGETAGRQSLNEEVGILGQRPTFDREKHGIFRRSIDKEVP